MSDPTTCRICGPTCQDETTVTEFDNGITIRQSRPGQPGAYILGPPGPTFTPVASPVTLDAPSVPDPPPTTQEGQRGVSGQLMQSQGYDKNVMAGDDACVDLTAEEAAAFMELLRNPKPPTPRMVALLREHRARESDHAPVTGYHVARAALEGLVRALAEGRSGHSAHPVWAGDLTAALEHVADMVALAWATDTMTSNEADTIAREYVTRGSARALAFVGTEERLRWHLEGQQERSRGRQEAEKRARRGK